MPDNDPIDEFLGLEQPEEPTNNLPVTHVQEVPIEQEPGDARVNDDYDSAREDIDSILEIGMETLEEFRLVAKASQQPRAYEVLTNMMKMLVDTAQAKLDAAAKKANIEKTKNDGRPITVKNQKNTVFIGTTAALQKYMEQHGTEIEADDTPDPFVED